MSLNLNHPSIDLKNAPRQLSYNKNSLQHIEDVNEDYIPDMDEIPNRINKYCLNGNRSMPINLDKPVKTSQRSQRHQSFSLINGSCSISVIDRTNQNRSKTEICSFVQLKLKEINNNPFRAPSSIESLKTNDSISNESKNDKLINNFKISSDINRNCPQTFKNQKQQLINNPNSNAFTQYYQNAVIEYIN